MMVDRIGSYDYYESLVDYSDIKPRVRYSFNLIKDSPLYNNETSMKESNKIVSKQITNRITNYLDEFRESMNTLKESTSKLVTDYESSVFQKRSVVNSNSDVAELMVEPGSEEGLYTIEVDKLAQDQSAQLSKDAQFTINGEEFTSSSNEIELLDEGLTIELEGKGLAEVRVEGNDKKIIEGVQAFIENYNQTLDLLELNPDNINVSSILEDFNEIIGFKESKLEEIGINVSEDNRLILDEPLFKDNLDKDKYLLEETLGDNLGIAKQINHKVDEVLSNPFSKYIDFPDYDLDRWSDFELYTEDSSIDYFFDERENGLLMDVIT